MVTFVHVVGGHIGLIGTYEAAMAYTFTFSFGVQKEIGLGIALMVDIAWFIPLFLLRFYYVWKEGLNLIKYAKNKQHL